jgi:NADP-dependent 3-hydroxy acid dehydrogenase YdfG
MRLEPATAPDGHAIGQAPGRNRLQRHHWRRTARKETVTTSGIKGKIVVITGAGSGMGEADAVLLAQRGAHVVLGDLRLDRLQTVASRIENDGGVVSYAQTDVRQRGELGKLVALALEQHGTLDVLISNAGVMPSPPRRSARRRVGPDDRRQPQRRALQHRCSPPSLPPPRIRALRQHGPDGCLHHCPNQSVYSATKFAVGAISEGLRKEARDRIRVTVVSPGFTRTNFAERVTNQEVKAQLDASRDTVAMPREVVANAIAFAIEQPDEVDVSEIVIRSTAQG